VNLNLPAVVMFVAGAVLMYSAVKNRDPRDVVLTALGQKARFGELSTIEPGAPVGRAGARGLQEGQEQLPSSGIGPRGGVTYV
jgi:hypothetical protein